MITWIHNPSTGEISFFKLSLIIPYIFSRKAVNCCLKSKAGYLASTCRNSSSPLSTRPLRNENPALCGEPRSPWYFIEIQKKKIIMNCKARHMKSIFPKKYTERERESSSHLGHPSKQWSWCWSSPLWS